VVRLRTLARDASGARRTEHKQTQTKVTDEVSTLDVRPVHYLGEVDVRSLLNVERPKEQHGLNLGLDASVSACSTGVSIALRIVGTRTPAVSPAA